MRKTVEIAATPNRPAIKITTPVVPPQYVPAPDPHFSVATVDDVVCIVDLVSTCNYRPEDMARKIIAQLKRRRYALAAPILYHDCFGMWHHVTRKGNEVTLDPMRTATTRKRAIAAAKVRAKQAAKQ